MERLFNLYKSQQSDAITNNHTASLLTNYRCHSSILAFTSSLFYQHTLLSRSSSETHPLAPYPLVFTCTSIDKNTKNLPAEDREEARVLVERMYSFVSTWPRSNPKENVGLLASTRKQVWKYNIAHMAIMLLMLYRWMSLKQKYGSKGLTLKNYPVKLRLNQLTSFKVWLPSL